jgi:hypothetical protein
VHGKICKITGNDRLSPVTGGDWLQPVENCKTTGLHQFKAVAVAVMSILGNKKLVRLSVALFGGKTRQDQT